MVATCTKCSSPLEEGAASCQICGSRVERDAAPPLGANAFEQFEEVTSAADDDRQARPTVERVVAPSPAVFGAGRPTATPVVPARDVAERAGTKPSSKSVSRAVWIAGSVTLIGVVVAAVLLSQRPSSDASTAVPSSNKSTGAKTRRQTIARSTSALAPADVGFRDRRRGWGWSDRCWKHFRRGRIGYAEAACKRGLRAARDNKARGALLYNLGRIAEAQGSRASAVKYYQRSLRVRPHKVVSNRLEALTRSVSH